MSDVCKICGAGDSTVVLSGIRDWEHGTEGVWDYRRCDRCGQIQLAPFPTVEDLIRAYPSDYPAYIPKLKDKKGWIYMCLRALQNAVLFSTLRPLMPAGGSALDIGAGNGDFLASLREIGAERMVGIDFNPRAIDILAGKGIEGYCGLFLDYPLPEEPFDLVIVNNYIEHVLDPGAELAKAWAALRPGGWMFGTLPNFASADRAIFGRYWGGTHVPRHTFHFTPDRLSRHLAEAGFRDIRLFQNLDSGSLAISVQNWLQRNVADLRNNPRVRHGRMAGFNLMLLGLAPVNLVFKLIGCSGVMSFLARRPER